MEFEYEKAKRALLIEQRGVDILYAAEIFKGIFFTRIDDRQDYGETRFISLGMVADEVFYVVHTERNGVTRLITTWKGGRHDRAKYRAYILNRNLGDER